MASAIEQQFNPYERRDPIVQLPKSLAVQRSDDNAIADSSTFGCVGCFFFFLLILDPRQKLLDIDLVDIPAGSTHELRQEPDLWMILKHYDKGDFVREILRDPK